MTEFEIINFPEYATLENPQVSMADMGDMIITSTISIARDIVPDFSYDWRIKFRNEYYIQPLRVVQGLDDNDNTHTQYTLTFYHEATYKLKTQYYIDVYLYGAGNVPIINSYNASKNLNLGDFVEDFNNVLNFYFGNSIIMDLNPLHPFDETPTAIAMNNAYIWDVLQQLQALYDVRWYWETIESVSYIKIGYNKPDITHIFDYGFTDGLLKFERQIQDPSIKNKLIVMGGTDNMPYRYFKDVDPLNPTYPADPDWIPELSNKFFEGIMPSEFRDYVQGWKAKGGEAELDRSDAYYKGYNDDRFHPVDYVQDLDSIEKYGIRPEILAAQEDIIPSIQGVSVVGIGRVDEVVFVEEITADIPSSDTYAEDVVTGESLTIPDGGVLTHNFNLKSNYMTLADVENLKFTISAKYNSSSRIEITYSEVSLLPIDGGVEVGTISLGEIKNGMNTATQDVEISNIPNGTYYIQVILSTKIFGNGVYNITASIGDITILSKYSIGFKETFDIWIKNVFSTTKSSDETPDEYIERVWNPLLTDDEFMVSFSSGRLSTADYSFRVISIYYDISKDGSEWRLTLEKSTDEAEAGIAFIPTQLFNAVAGDFFYFLGITLPHQYVLWAEAQVSQYGYDALKETANVSPTWVVSTDPIRIDQVTEDDVTLFSKLTVGSKFRAKNKRLIAQDGTWISLYISSLTLTYGESMLPEMEIVVTDNPTTQLSPVDQLSAEISSLSTKIAGISNIEKLIQAIGDKLYLRKDGVPQQSSSDTSFGNHIQSSGARKGQIGGTGWLMYKDSNGNWVLETDIINVRKDMNVNNLVINQITAIGGKQIESAASIEISRVEDTNEGYICYFEQKQGSVGNLFQKDDVAYSSVWDNQDLEIRFYKRRVLEIGINYVVLSKTESNGQDIPEVGDVICHYGNYTNIDRQYVIIRDVIGGGYERMLEGLNNVNSDGVEYYFAGRIQGSFPRFQIGDENRGGLRVKMYMDGNQYKTETQLWANKFTILNPNGNKDLEETLDELGNIQIGGVNLLDNSNGSSQFVSYNESILTKSVVEEFGFTDANRVITSGGYGGYAEIRSIARMGTPADGEVVSLSFYIKNNGTEDIRLSSNQGGMGYTLTPNESKVVKWEGIVGNGFGAVQIQVRASSAEQDLDFTWSRIMYERGNRSTDWFPSANDLKSTGKGILSIQNFYLISPNNTGVTTSTSGWQEAVVNPTAINKYLWNYEKITYTDGSFTDSTPAVISMYAADGIGISQIVDYYAVNNSTTPPLDSDFSTDVKNPTSTNRYLWNYEAIGYTNGAIHTSDKRIIGVYGERGEDGQPALPTVYRMSDTQPSKPTSSSVPPPNWSLTPPSASEVMSNPAPIDNPMLLSAPLGVTVSPAVVNKNSGDAWTGDEVEISMILSNGQKQILTFSDGRDWTGNNQWTWDNPSSYRPTTSTTYLLICETSEGTRSYQGQLTVVIQGGEKVLSYIDVISPPNKDTYNVGEVLDTNGMIVRAYYTDGTSANLSNSQVSESYNFSTAGTKTVTVSYSGKSDTFSVTVVESSVTLSSIDVVNLPTKTTYYVGDVINTSGMVVNAVYSNGSRSTIPNNQVQTSYNFNTTGTKTVTVSYSGKSDTFSVSVVARPAATLSRIDVITAPQKTSYKINEYIDTNGLYVLGTYSDGTTADVTSQCTYSPQVFTTTGLKTVTVSFSGESDTFTVDIYTEESSSGTQIWACTALGWNESGGVTGWSEPTRWNGEDGARNAYTLFSFAYGASLDIRPSNWSYSVPTYVEGQHLWQRVQQYEPNSTNTGWVLVSTSYSVLREYIDDKIEDAKNEAISTFFEDAISAEEIEKLKNGSAPFVFDTDKQVAYLRKAIIEYLATDQILTDLIIAKNIKTAISGERVEITQASRGLTAFDEDGNIAMKVHGKEFSTFSSAPTTVAVAQKSINQEAGGANPNDNIGETDVAIATITIAAGKDVNEVTLPSATIDLQALVELGSVIEGLGNARIGVRLMLDNIELGSLGIISINGTISNSTTIPSQKLSLASGSHNLYFRASWDCTVSEGAERAEVVGSVRWASSTIQIDYKDDIVEFSKEGMRVASNGTHYIEFKRLPDGTIQETRVGVTTNATYGVLAAGLVSATGSLSKQYGKVTSSSMSSTGMFRINHSIGHTNYTPQVTLYGEAGFADIQGIYSTYFIIRTRTTALDLDDKSFTFACLG